MKITIRFLLNRHDLSAVSDGSSGEEGRTEANAMDKCTSSDLSGRFVVSTKIGFLLTLTLALCRAIS